MNNLTNMIKIGTLGPSGTSSEAAVDYFLNKYESNPKNFSVTLFKNFQSVLHELIHGDLFMALVPHAYSGINQFYINRRVSLYRMFKFDTPTYGLAKRLDAVLPSNSCRIVSHPAPVHLLDTLLPQIGLFDYETMFVSSTSEAAEVVQKRKADLALTNMNAMKKYNLVCCALYGSIPMGWSVFTKKG